MLPDEWRRPVVLRVHPTPQRTPLAEREATIQEFCAAAGYPAPRVLAVLRPGDAIDLPVQVMERVAGRPLLEVLTTQPWRFAGRAAALGSLHARLHLLSTDGWPFPDEASRPALAERRLFLARRVASADRDEAPALRKALAKVEPLLPQLTAAEPVVCHGDFHPLNVVCDGDDMAVVDWTDGCLGDRHGDVARLLYLLREVRIANPGRPGRILLRAVTPSLARRYLAGYASVGAPLDTARLEAWEPVHLLHDWARALLTLDAPDGRSRINPAVVPWIRTRLDRALEGRQ